MSGRSLLIRRPASHFGTTLLFFILFIIPGITYKLQSQHFLVSNLSHKTYNQNIPLPSNKFYSQLNTSGREPSPCDTPVSHSIDIPPEELKILRSLERLLPPTLPAPTRKHIDKATNMIYTHVNIHTDNEISEKE